MSAAELLFEVGVEEIPAGSVAPALDALAQLVGDALDELRLASGARRVYGTPRRLVVAVADVQTHQEDRVERKLGPPKAAAFDEEGRPTKTALGYCKGQGIDLAELRIFQTDKGEYVGYERTVTGRPSAELLPDVLADIVSRVPWKKSMRWGDRPERFVRPLRWMLCKHGDAVVPVRYGDIKAGGVTYGHRFLAPDAIEVTSRFQYQKALREARVIVDPDERRHAIVEGLRQAVKHRVGSDGRLVEDDGLLDEVVNLTEWPATVLGEIPEEFLVLPREVLIASMRNHQRYFAVETDDGELAPYFLTITGTEVRDLNVVRAGNERVLSARLADARFFWQQDQETPLVDRTEELRTVTFAARVGSYADKQARVAALASRLAEEVVARSFSDVAQVCVDARRAGELCKCDLVTGMVGEFPELQGIMGGHYARAEGETENVCVAIAEHYLPRHEDDPLPQTRAAAAVALADRLDSICQLWAVGLRPTGNKDPYAIRQQTIGMLRIVFGRGLNMSLRRWVDVALPQQTDGGDRDAMAAEICAYMLDRVKALFVAEGVAPDVVDAVLALGYDDPVAIRARVEALYTVIHQRDFERFFDLAKRVRKIAPHPREVAAAGGYTYPGLGEVDEGLLQHPKEQALWQAFVGVRDEVGRYLQASEFVEALQAQRQLIQPVDEFFNDGPKVLDDDPALRGNRTTLCAVLDRLMCSVADVTAVSSTHQHGSGEERPGE